MNRITQLKIKAQEKVNEAKALLGTEEFSQESFDALMAEAESLKAQIRNLEAVENVGEGLEVEDVPTNSTDNKVESKKEDKTFNAAYQVKFGDETVQQEQILKELLGNDYKGTLYNQEIAFAKYLRNGVEALSLDDQKLLKTQVFPFSTISEFIKAGFSFGEMKATMVEAQGSLGGYAVPVQRQSEILSRLPGMTAVRGSGATVVNLDTGNSVEFVEYTGADSAEKYAGALRGQWGSETQSPPSDNATLGMKLVSADVYTYKIPMSQSLVEDASNLVSLVSTDIANTLAIDEDEAFLIGDGVGKPYGILPESANGLSLTQVISGAAAALTADGLINLRRGVASQYRNNQGAVFVGNSDTMGDIEVMRTDEGGAGTGFYMFPSFLTDGILLRSQTAESEALPDVGAGTFPLIYGNMAGYYIVERNGLTISRYQDSNTGPNKVEFHVRRRVGGRLIKPWMFAVQKVAAS